jgi:peptidoglycan hydrolase-like protein with peptidoglycan-binding domain
MVVGIAVAAVAASGVAATLMLAGQGSSAPRAATTVPTVAITRGDLVDSKTVSGTLGYADAHTLAATVQGTLTAISQAGATLGRGDALYMVDRMPVTLMFGAVPMYRQLKVGVADGPDTAQLEQNLAVLGYSGMTVDEHFTSATAAVVSRWQTDRGLPVTGAVDAAQVVFLPGAVRVAQPLLRVGATVGQQRDVLALTATSRVVTVSLPLTDQALAPNGTAVTVVLPDRRSATGKITKVGTVAAAPTTDSSTQATSTTTTIPVEVTLDDAANAAGPDQTPVSVRLVRARRVNVLSIPVEALLALREGGYGVEIVDGATTRTIPVETGLFATDRVEVSGPELNEGMHVVVPA